jgi:acetyltransferase-like isoleucine patch superfamily enzyme
MQIFKKIGAFIRRRYFMIFIKPGFGSFGKGSFIKSPLSLGNPKSIFIGNDVMVQYKSWLAARPQTGNHEARLTIDDGSRIGNFNHIYATNSIHIEKNVLTADKVYISDNLHSYTNIHVPILKQPIRQLNSVKIGEGAWLGENVCIIGASVGKQSVVGANSVVTKDVPDYCIVVGSPAKIIKRYNSESGEWEKTNPDGSYLAKS